MRRSRAAYGQIKQTPNGVGTFYQAVCQDIVAHTGVTRASVWILSPQQLTLISVCVHDTRDGSFAGGTILSARDYPEYFAAISDDLRVVASDARTYPATSAFCDSYFIPLGIYSLLDYVVLIDGKPGMILCCEQCDAIKEWTPRDVRYLRRMASVVAMGHKANLAAA